VQGEPRQAAARRRVAREYYGEIFTDELEPVHIASVLKKSAGM